MIGANCVFGAKAAWPTAFGIVLRLALTAQAAEQCVPAKCAAAKAEVALYGNLTEQIREKHFNKLQVIIEEALADNRKAADDKRLTFPEHLQWLTGFADGLKQIDEAANARPNNLQIGRLVSAINAVIGAKNALDEARRTKRNSPDDTTISTKYAAYVAALDALYVTGIETINPVGGNDFYSEAENYVEAQKVQFQSHALIASRYGELQNFKPAEPPPPSGNKSLRNLDTFQVFMTKPVGGLVSKIGARPPKPLECRRWIDEFKSSSRLPDDPAFAVPVGTSQGLICAQLALEEANKKQKADCQSCQDQAPKPGAQTEAPIRIVSVIYGKLSRDRPPKRPSCAQPITAPKQPDGKTVANSAVKSTAKRTAKPRLVAVTTAKKKARRPDQSVAARCQGSQQAAAQTQPAQGQPKPEQPTQAPAKQEEAKPKPKYVYRKGNYCDATNYFRITCEMAEVEGKKYCLNKDGRLEPMPNNGPCPDGGRQYADFADFVPREGNQKRKICKVEIDPRKLCGGYIPAETEDRLATIRYECADKKGTNASVWEVRPLKRDKETVYLICPDDNRPSEYLKIEDPAKNPIPTEPKKKEAKPIQSASNSTN